MVNQNVYKQNQSMKHSGNEMNELFPHEKFKKGVVLKLLTTSDQLVVPVRTAVAEIISKC